MSRNKIHYEWAIEFIDRDGDIEDSNFQDKLKKLKPPRKVPDADGYTEDLVLIRDVWNEWHGSVDRQYAYVKNGILPEKFDYGAKVPKRFHAEYKRWIKKQAKAAKPNPKSI